MRASELTNGLAIVAWLRSEQGILSARRDINVGLRNRMAAIRARSAVAAPDVSIDDSAVAAARAVLERKRVGIFIVAFQAERFIDSVLARIPDELRGEFAQIVVIDDSSTDRTFDVAAAAGERLGLENLLVLRTPFNRGYGGNQKLGYLHAIRHQLDYVILLHGDGQYAPECLPEIINAFADGEADAVIGSRMIRRMDALRGRMPVYKWLGNQVLTAIENKMLGSHLSEFHSGYRAYKVDALKAVPFQLNSNDFHFDTELLVQLIRTGRTVKEVPIPTYYGDEICHVNGLKYGFNCLKAVTKVRLSEVGLYYEPKFDLGEFDDGYLVKEADNSLHQYILSQPWSPNWTVADIGANRGILASKLARRVKRLVAVDLERPDKAGAAEAVALDLNSDFDATLGQKEYDAVLALDVIEHLERPEEAVRRLAAILRPGGRLYASTGNIAYFAVRLSLLLGQFNYGKRGILDLTHHRLFTVYSFRKLLQNSGFTVREIRGFGPPIRDMVGTSLPLRAADTSSAALARWLPRLFAFNFLVIAEKEEELDDIYARTAASAAEH